ncbi:unnamed protein product, partial [Brassica oleracea]
MTNNPIAPPRKKKKKTKKPPSFSSIPDDVIVNVLARISKSHYCSLSLVSKNFNSLLSSPDIYFVRSLIGNTEARLYVRLWVRTPSSGHRHRWFTLGYRQGQLTLVLIGGSNENKPTRAARVLDCRSHTWRSAPDMKVARKLARLYVFTINNEKYAYDPTEESWVQEAGFEGLEAPPSKKKKKTKKPPSFSSIPDDVIVNILARILKSHYRSLSLVSKHFNSLLSSPDIYFARSLIGNTDARLYVCLWLPTLSSSHRHRWFNLIYRQDQLTLVPVRRALASSYSPDRLNSTTVAVQSEIYQMGGSNEDKRTRAVRVLDCRNQTWRRAPDMKVARKHASDDYINSYHNGEVFGGRLYFFNMNNNKKNYAYDPTEGR